MNSFFQLVWPARWKYQWRYWRGQTPWDTGITPPEVKAFMEVNSPAKALDLGCGTGTNAIALARRGWHVVGIDFAAKAIRKARSKSAAAGLEIAFYTADVTRLDFLTERFDYVLDIGCLFTLRPRDRLKYARTLERFTRPNAVYMLYAWLPHMHKGKSRGISPEAVQLLLSKTFTMDRVEPGEYEGRPSAWYWYRKC